MLERQLWAGWKKFLKNRKIVFNISVFKDSGQLEAAFKSLPLDNRGEAMVGGYEAQKLFSPKGAVTPFSDVTVYTIPAKNTALIFYGSDFSQVSANDLAIILSTFKFTPTPNETGR